MSKPRASQTDPVKGYRIHFNTLSHSEVLPTFKQAHAGTPLENSKWYPNEPDLDERESRTVKGLDDLLALMQTGDHRRLADSLVVFGTNKPISWKEFFIRESAQEGMERFADLYNRVGKIKGGDPIPCAMVFKVAETKTLGVYRDYFKAGKKAGRYRDISLKGQGLHQGGKNIDFELSFMHLKQAAPYDTLNFREDDILLVTGMAQRDYASAHLEVVKIIVDNPKAYRLITQQELTTPPKPQEPYKPPALTYEDLGRLD